MNVKVDHIRAALLCATLSAAMLSVAAPTYPQQWTPKTVEEFRDLMERLGAGMEPMILDYVDRLSAAGVDAASFETTGKGHGTLDSDIGREGEPLNAVVLEFLKR